MLDIGRIISRCLTPVCTRTRTRIYSKTVSNLQYCINDLSQVVGSIPKQICILKGPECVSRSRPFSHRLATAPVPEFVSPNQPNLGLDSDYRKCFEAWR